MRIKGLLVCLGLVGSGLITACGKGMPESPIAPSPSTNTTASAPSAIVSGRVGSGSGFGSSLMSMSRTSGASAGVTVTATGTSASAITDASGRFQLTVPPGPVELHFTGSGVDSRTTLGAVTAGETMDVVIDVNGSSATVQVKDRTVGNWREVEGKVSAVPPTTASGTFRIGDRLINTNAETDFFLNGGNGSLQDVSVGSFTRATGPAGSDAMVALDVNIENSQVPGGSSGGGGTGDGGGSGSGGGGGGTGGGGGGTGGGSTGGGDTTVTGPISSVLGLCPALNFTVAGKQVHTNAQTQFDLSCLGLLTASGNASATGTQNADGSITAKVVRRQ